jgi:hypothetical protein
VKATSGPREVDVCEEKQNQRLNSARTNTKRIEGDDRRLSGCFLFICAPAHFTMRTARVLMAFVLNPQGCMGNGEMKKVSAWLGFLTTIEFMSAGRN